MPEWGHAGIKRGNFSFSGQIGYRKIQNRGITDFTMIAPEQIRPQPTLQPTALSAVIPSHFPGTDYPYPSDPSRSGRNV
jgi:hypothetical protein